MDCVTSTASDALIVMFSHAPKGQLIIHRRRKQLQEPEILHLWRNFKYHFALRLVKSANVE